MKKLALFVAVVFISTALVGCGKKQDESASMEGLSGVVSENVVSVSDMTYQDGIPVIVENAENIEGQSVGEMAAVAVAPVVGKPTNKNIQQALKNAGFYTGKVDGDIGPRTKKAIEAFQAQNGLKADGKVGVKTWKVLADHLDKTPEVVNPTEAVQTIE